MSVTLRDFLYLDVDRIRSLLSQLEGGIVEKTVERLTTAKDAKAGASLFNLFELGGSLVREHASEQTKTLQDAVYLLFEEAAKSSNLFEASVDLSYPGAWESGDVHRSLQAVQLLRVTAPTRILDSKHFRERIDRLAKWPALVVGFSARDQLASIKSPKDRARRLEQMVAEQMGGPAPTELMSDMGEFVELFMGGQISVRQFPCGLENPQFALVGTLIDRPGFLQEEREALYSKYGAAPSSWTMVSQVTTVPVAETGSEPDLSAVDLLKTDEQVDRGQIEEMAVSLMQLLESTGIAEAPAFPAIAVTPLALFREAELPAIGLDDFDSQTGR
jgi:hypothetical protein